MADTIYRITMRTFVWWANIEFVFFGRWFEQLSLRSESMCFCLGIVWNCRVGSFGFLFRIDFNLGEVIFGIEQRARSDSSASI